MPRPEFFRSLGLFVLHDFLRQEECALVRTEMGLASSQDADIFGNGGEELVDKTVRRVLRTKVKGPAERFVRECLESQRQRLEEHFSVSLEPNPPPEFLIYNSGGFYVPHTDASRNNRSHRRRVSVVVFLNGESDQPRQDCYGGGKLTFHGIVNEPEWANCAFSLDAHPGLLVAFRPDLVHEVRPVTFGQRFTIASWFLATVTESTSESRALGSAYFREHVEFGRSVERITQ